jgi:tetratricopeptide (TPR) repeat protein
MADDFKGAFDSLTAIPDTVTDPRVFAYRASLLLAVGQVSEAQLPIDRALALDPGHAPALALQAIVAVAQNAKAEAVRLANQAVALDSTSVAAQLAQSYARQAAFDLPGARQSLEAAVQLDPASALVHARLADFACRWRRPPCPKRLRRPLDGSDARTDTNSAWVRPPREA